MPTRGAFAILDNVARLASHDGLPMDQQLLCAWLQLPPGAWPPDHYTLLGLNARDSDVARIEQQVYQRMEIVRRYQLTHPEPATEAMNRLAQALVCLTDPVAKKAYDAALFPEPRQGNGADAEGTRLQQFASRQRAPK